MRFYRVEITVEQNLTDSSGRSYKLNRVVRIRPVANVTLVFRPARRGLETKDANRLVAQKQSTR